jgi:perosamine synthetase
MRSGGWITEHAQTAAFEQALASFVGAKHCVVVNNGTIALVAALWAVGVRDGDEVIVPNLTMIATATAAVLIGAKPVLIDVEAESLDLDPALTAAAITPRTKAVVFVSFNGRSGQVREIAKLCRGHEIALVEDAAQSLGSYSDQQHLGTIGDLGTFSFSVPKIMSTGQGGAIVTNDDTLGASLRRIKDFGRARGGIDTHETIGFNFKFTDVQAVIGLEQLKKVPLRMLLKRAMYSRYQENLRDTAAVEMIPTNIAETSPWFIDILVPDPDALQAHLAAQGIGSRRIYPPINEQPAFAKATTGRPAHRELGTYSITKDAARRGLWLPSAAQLTNDEIDRVCETIREYYLRQGL